MGSYALQTPPRVAHIKPSGPKPSGGARKAAWAKKERLNDGKNNGQAPHGARKLPRSKTFHISLVVSNSSNIDKCKLSQKV